MKSWKIAVLLSYISIASASAAIITPALPVIEAEWHLSHGATNWLVSIFLLGYMLGQMFYGPLANALGRLNALRIGFMLNLIGIGICLCASFHASYHELIWGRFITALGASAGLSCTFILLNESLPAERAKHALSFAVVSFTIGIGLAVMLGGMLTQYLRWQDCFYLLLAHGILMLISTYFFTETMTQAKAISLRTIAKNYALALAHSKLIIFSLFVGLVSLFSYCYSAAAPVIAQRNLGLDAAAYGYWNSLNMLGMFLGAWSAARLLKRYRNEVILIFALSALAVALIILAILTTLHVTGTISFFGLSVLMYYLSSLIFPAASHTASNAIADKANASSAMNLINMSAAVLGVVVMGYLPFDRLWAFITITFGFLLLASFIWLLKRRHIQ
jgi:MFS family permease